MHLAHSVGASSSSVRPSTAPIGGAHCAGAFVLATSGASFTPAPGPGAVAGPVTPFGAAPPVTVMVPERPPFVEVVVVVVVSTDLPPGVEVAVVTVLVVSTVLFAPPVDTLFVSMVVFMLVVFDEPFDPIPNFDIREDMSRDD